MVEQIDTGEDVALSIANANLSEKLPTESHAIMDAIDNHSDRDASVKAVTKPENESNARQPELAAEAQSLAGSPRSESPTRDEHATDLPEALVPSNQDLLELLKTLPKADPQPDHAPDEPATLPSITPQTPIAPSYSHNLPAQPHSATTLSSTTQPVSGVSTTDSDYEQFLAYERRLASTIGPGTFEAGARMFVGNISSDRTIKRALFDKFSKYGKLAQISLKSSYGFVQFHTAIECRAAVQGEQDIVIAGQSLHLEVSKPQGSRQTVSTSLTRSRSRSPSRRHDRPQAPSTAYRDGGRYFRDESLNPTSHDRAYAAPDRNYRAAERDGLPMRDIDILAFDNLDEPFIRWMEDTFRHEQLQARTTSIPYGTGIGEYMRHSAQSGVLAVVICDRRLRSMNKVDLRFFDRTTPSSVRFDEYSALDVPVAAQLIKSKKAPSFNATSNFSAPHNPDVAAMIAKMDPTALAAIINQVKGS